MCGPAGSCDSQAAAFIGPKKPSRPSEEFTSVFRAAAREVLEDAMQSASFKESIMDVVWSALEHQAFANKLDPIIEAYLRGHPSAMVNPRPDSLVIGKASEQLKLYFNAENIGDATMMRDEALKFREETVLASDAAIRQRPEHLQPKPRGAKKGESDD